MRDRQMDQELDLLDEALGTLVGTLDFSLAAVQRSACGEVRRWLRATIARNRGRGLGNQELRQWGRSRKRGHPEDRDSIRVSRTSDRHKLFPFHETPHVGTPLRPSD
jgi:hypothetical protein